MHKAICVLWILDKSGNFYYVINGHVIKFGVQITSFRKKDWGVSLNKFSHTKFTVCTRATYYTESSQCKMKMLRNFCDSNMKLWRKRLPHSSPASFVVLPYHLRQSQSPWGGFMDRCSWCQRWSTFPGFNLMLKEMFTYIFTGDRYWSLPVSVLSYSSTSQTPTCVDSRKVFFHDTDTYN